MYSGRHVVNIEFIPLGPKSDHEEGDFGDWYLYLKFQSLNFLIKNNLLSNFIERIISKK